MVITSAPPMNCTAPLSPPQNGNISDHSVPALPNTSVTFECSVGLFPEEIFSVTCLGTGEWDRNPAEIVCRNESSELHTVHSIVRLHYHIFLFSLSVNCSSAPSEPVNGMIVNLDNINTRENSVITFMCDPGFSPSHEMIATCNNSGLWHPDPALLECKRLFHI